MRKKKNNAIPDSDYYDSTNKKWIIERIELPDEKTVGTWLDAWENNYQYRQQESALNKLFFELAPENKNIEDILIKVCTLNVFYSTYIYGVVDVAQKILEMNIDARLNSGERDIALVDELNEGICKATGKHNLPFASKYCSHHKPELYPIYDSYVKKMLHYYEDTNKSFFGIDEEKITEPSDYAEFCGKIDRFQEKCGLTLFSVKDIDKMLWQMGKHHFPKYKEDPENE